jgi:hypothetical protein
MVVWVFFKAMDEFIKISKVFSRCFRYKKNALKIEFSSEKTFDLDFPTTTTAKI